jgi:hypothetical protein
VVETVSLASSSFDDSDVSTVGVAYRKLNVQIMFEPLKSHDQQSPKDQEKSTPSINSWTKDSACHPNLNVQRTNLLRVYLEVI